MMEIIKNAIDANAFVSTSTSAGYINPELWNRDLREFIGKNLVIADKARVLNDLLGQAGDTINVSIDAAPTIADALTESSLGSVSATTMTQVVYAPTEYGKFYQFSDKQARRGFFSIMDNMQKKIGYSLALKQDTFAYELIRDNAGKSQLVNDKAHTSLLLSSDTLDFDTIVKAAVKVKEGLYDPKYLIVSVGGSGQLARTTQFREADKAGDSSTFRRGFLGTIYGLQVFESDVIAKSGNVTKAIMIGETPAGEPCFGKAVKALPYYRMDYDVLGRFTTLGGVEEWDMEIEQANAFCVVSHYE